MEPCGELDFHWHVVDSRCCSSFNNLLCPDLPIGALPPEAVFEGVEASPSW